tara:strand:- start:6858 stop:7193 length:336 start_codon:yes stop_codon:yes gene_type:complete
MVIEGDNKIILTRRNVNKNGDTAYSREGVRSTVYANKGMFVGDAPETITLESTGHIFTPVKPGIDPEVVKAQAVKAQVRAAKAQERAARAAELAKKAATNATKASAVAAEL